MATISVEAPAGLLAHPTRSAVQASRAAFVALLQRDLAVLRKNVGEFVGRDDPGEVRGRLHIAAIHGPEQRRKSLRVRVIDLHSQECIDMLAHFIQAHPELWAEDIGE